MFYWENVLDSNYTGSSRLRLSQAVNSPPSPPPSPPPPFPTSCLSDQELRLSAVFLVYFIFTAGFPYCLIEMRFNFLTRMVVLYNHNHHVYDKTGKYFFSQPGGRNYVTLPARHCCV